MKKISIAMCIYNGEKYLKEQLDSIINQTYTNIELIIPNKSIVQFLLFTCKKISIFSE